MWRLFVTLVAFSGSLFGLSQAQYADGGCPEPYGVQTYPDEKYCDKFYKVNHQSISRV